MGGWLEVDSRRHLSAVDRDVVARTLELARQADRVARVLPATLHLIRDNMAGQPRAAASDATGSGRRPWCWVHERSVDECDRAGEVCLGEVLSGPSDPVGDAAVSGDRAAGHHRELLRKLSVAANALEAAAAIMAGYPAQPAQLEEPGVDDEVGTVWCRACHKDDRYCQPITVRRSTGKPYYTGLCKWCGETSAVIGADPPTWLVEKHHRGERVMPADIERARQSVERSKKSSPRSSKPKSRRRRK